MAQESHVMSHGTDYKNDTATFYRFLQQQSMKESGFVKPKSVTVSLEHYDYMEPYQFAIQLAAPDVVSGCYEIGPLQYEANFYDPYFLDVEVMDYKRTLMNVQNPEFECLAQNKVSTAQIVLNRQDLMERQINQIRFKHGFVVDYYDISYADNGIALLPKTQVFFKDSKDGASFTPRPGMLVQVEVPMAQRNDNIAGQIQSLAARNSLISTDQSMVFRDRNGGLSQEISRNGYAEIGTVQVERLQDSANGAIKTRIPLRVFVKAAQ